MTAAALSAPIPGERDARPGLGRLTLVELRKMTDTRAGFWLQLAVIGLTLAIAGIIVGFGTNDDMAFENMLQATIQPSSNLLPVIGILLVSSEWSQRTAQISFTLGAAALARDRREGAGEPRRGDRRLRGLDRGGAGRHGDRRRHVLDRAAGVLGQIAVLLALGMLGGVAFGALLLASAPAIVAYFLAPIAWAALLTIPAIDGAAPWLDGSRSFAPMTEGTMSATEWAHVGTTALLWVALPLALGAMRIIRSEVP